jgi:DNA-binding transcriptional LysR family regulator
MEFHDLEVFLSVAREKSFSKAAKTVMRTQPAVSLSIRRLEDELEEKLFDRSSKEPVLTYEGEILFQYAQKLLNMRKEVFQAISEVQGLHRGHIRIGANEIGILPMLEYISHFHNLYPNIRIEVRRTSTRHITRELMRREIDFGIVSYDSTDPNLDSTYICDDRVCCVTYPTHPLAQHPETISIKRLKDEKFAAHQNTSRYRKEIEKLFSIKNVPLNIDIELPNIESIKFFVEAGYAMAILPWITVAKEIEQGRLVEVDVKEFKELKLDRKIQMIHRKGSQELSHSARALIESIAQFHANGEKAFFDQTA